MDMIVATRPVTGIDHLQCETIDIVIAVRQCDQIPAVVVIADLTVDHVVGIVDHRLAEDGDTEGLVVPVACPDIKPSKNRRIFPFVQPRHIPIALCYNSKHFHEIIK